MSAVHPIQPVVFWVVWIFVIYAAFSMLSSCGKTFCNWFQCNSKWFHDHSSPFSIFFFNHPYLPFNIVATWSFTCLNVRGWSKYSNPMYRAFLIASNSSIGCFQMPSMVGFNLITYPQKVVNHPFLPPPTSLLSKLQCTIGVTYLPWKEAISIPNLFITLSNVHRLVLCFACLKDPPEDNTWLFNWVETSVVC